MSPSIIQYPLSLRPPMRSLFISFLILSHLWSWSCWNCWSGPRCNWSAGPAHLRLLELGRLPRPWEPQGARAPMAMPGIAGNNCQVVPSCAKLCQVVPSSEPSHLHLGHNWQHPESAVALQHIATLQLAHGFLITELSRIVIVLRQEGAPVQVLLVAVEHCR